MHSLRRARVHHPVMTALVLTAASLSHARAAVELPQVRVQDVHGCLDGATLQRELRAVLPNGMDAHLYGVTVVVGVDPAVPEARTAQLEVVDQQSQASLLRRELAFNATECADAARLLSRMVVPVLADAPRLPDATADPNATGEPNAMPPAPPPRPRRAEPPPVPAGFLWLQTPFELGDAMAFSNERVPSRGPDRTRIGWEDFYRDVGREDLAQSYVTRGRIKVLLWTLGLLSGVGGLATLFLTVVGSPLLIYAVLGLAVVLALSLPVSWPVVLAVVAQVALVWLLVVGLCAVGCVGLLGAGFFINRHGVEEAERVRLKEEHNRALVPPSPAGK